MSDEQFKFFFERMPSYRQKKAMRYVKAEDRKLCAAAFALLDYALILKGYKVGEYELIENEKGKPYLKNLPLKFSLSHTSDVVACAVDENEIGVDVQKKVDKYESAVRRFYCGNEKKLVIASQNPVEAFAKIWTLKESYAKCIGTGLSTVLAEYDFSSVALIGAGKLYGYEFTVFDGCGYVLAVCSSSAKRIKKISLSEILERLRFKL